MPKLKWKASDPENALTAADIDAAPDGFQPYTGGIPSGGLYCFYIKRGKHMKFGTGNEGISLLLELDGSWKPKHAEYDGCPMWDRVVMTRSASGFAKAFKTAIGVSSSDLISRIIVDEDGLITKIGDVSFPGKLRVLVNVRRGEWNDESRLEKAGSGYFPYEDAAEEAPAKGAKKAAAAAKPAKTGKAKAGSGGRGKPKADQDDDPPF